MLSQMATVIWQSCFNKGYTISGMSQLAACSKRPCYDYYIEFSALFHQYEMRLHFREFNINNSDAFNTSVIKIMDQLPHKLTLYSATPTR
jgi:hypothetical protein